MQNGLGKISTLFCNPFCKTVFPSVYPPALSAAGQIEIVPFFCSDKMAGMQFRRHFIFLTSACSYTAGLMYAPTWLAPSFPICSLALIGLTGWTYGLIPGVLGCSGSAENDTFSRNLLKHPQYTRPRVFEGIEVPEELLSGDHGKIERFRFLASVARTIERRPDLIKRVEFSEAERKLLQQSGLLERIERLEMKRGERP